MQSKESNTKAHELAEFVRGFRKDQRYLYFIDWLSERYHMQDELSNDIYDKFADEIESLGEQDGLPWPLDRDGVPIKLGDTVYYKGKPDEDFVVEKITIIESNIDMAPCINILGRSADKNRSYNVPSKEVTHKIPRTLDDIIKEMVSAFYEDRLRTDLVREAYELGKKETE